MATGIPLIEIYWSMVDKADKKFSKIRDLPLFERTKFDTYFYKVFKVYTELWKFQQENRHKLVEAGLKRWEIGEIASRIAQLYFGQYMRTSEASYLSEAYVFYEAILTREYFKDGPFHDLNLAHKQLRFLARFISVCLLLNRREMVHQLVNHLRTLLDECKRTFQDANFREWKLVVQEIVKFMKADTTFSNIRPMRYSLVLDPHPDTLTHVSSHNPKRKLKLRDAVLSSYHPSEVKFSEITLDNYRMLQCLEWEPSGALYKSGGGNGGQSGSEKATGVNHSHDISDPTLPPNPRKFVLYRPPITQFIAVLAAACDDLPSDGVLLIYLSGRGGQIFSSSLGTGSRLSAENSIKSSQSQALSLDLNSTLDIQEPSLGKVSEVILNTHEDCLHIGSRGNEGSNFVYPSDLLPFTRRPLFIIIDSESSGAFKVLSGSEKGEPVIMLLSSQFSPPIISNGDSSRHVNGSLFTLFLTAPVQAFCLLLGFSGSDVQMDAYEKVDQLLSSSLNNWGLTLATSVSLDSVWSQVFTDPFLRRLLLRFIFCRAVLALYAPTHKKPEFIPQCVPSLPESVQPTAPSIQSTILQIANVLGVSSSFIISSNVLACQDSRQIAIEKPPS